MVYRTLWNLDKTRLKRFLVHEFLVSLPVGLSFNVEGFASPSHAERNIWILS